MRGCCRQMLAEMSPRRGCRPMTDLRSSFRSCDLGVMRCATAVPRLPRPRTPDSPAIVAVDTGGVGSERASWYGDAVRAALRLAVAEVGVTARNARERPLIAMPFVGIGAGGAGDIKGDVLLSILDAAASAVGGAASNDVTLVTLHQRHLQAPKRRADSSRLKSGASWWLELDDERRRLAQRLCAAGEDAAAGALLARASVAARDCPAGTKLPRRLVGDDAKLQSPEFRELDVLDQARLIRKHLGDRTYRQRMQSIFGQRERRRPSAAAGLPRYSDEIYDDPLRGRVADWSTSRSSCSRGSTSVGASRWLLKLHGTITDPESLVLSRDDDPALPPRGQRTLGGVVQAMLLTRHMLFVGFSLTDDHFHRIVHDVRAAAGHRRRACGSGRR